jgi:hypothetical protein
MKTDLLWDRYQETKEWYKPAYIHYDYYQCIWLLLYAGMMKEGKYPPEGRESGYVGGSKAVSQAAPYERVCQIIAEVGTRLAQCGTDREYAEHFYTDNWSLEQIANHYSKDVRFVSGKIISVMKYVGSGPCQRWMDCKWCPKRDTCHKKKRKGITYQDWTGHRREMAMVK